MVIVTNQKLGICPRSQFVSFALATKANNLWPHQA